MGRDGKGSRVALEEAGRKQGESAKTPDLPLIEYISRFPQGGIRRAIYHQVSMEEKGHPDSEFSRILREGSKGGVPFTAILT